MEWKEFVTAWAKQEHTIESLELSAPLTEEELECVLAMFPNVGTEVEIKDACNNCLISERKFKEHNEATYIKCGLPTNKGKRPLRDRLITEFNLLPEFTSPPPATPTTQIDWLTISQDLLSQQKNLTTNPLQLGVTRNLDDVHVPLGLMERKERPQVKQEPSPEMGSQLLQPTELTETKRFEHEEFLAEVVGKRTTNSKHIAIIGEPGAGKTTLLTKIGEWLIDRELQKDNPESSIVVWVSLASLESQDLSDYLYKVWLKNAHPAARPPDSWASELENLITNKRVWLLLDGLDETSRSDAPNWLNSQLSGWGQNLRVVVTCRLNQWDGASNNLVNSFEVYRTLDYEYRTATGEDRVLEFLTKWFDENPDTAKRIRTSLDGAGKERIKDLVKNPLRLTLFCASWTENPALPETQAELYRGFVNYLYRWKEQEFQAEVSLRQHLDPALGKLAIAGLNRQPNHYGAVRRFRFTEQEIAKLWQGLPATLLPAAKKLGWLNVVGKEEAGENIYAFFHPTFQEYFAACSIDDWDYFLPRAHVDRPVPCKGETEPTYRVFEKEWQQTILLWIGRGDVGDELKEELIEKLTNFGEQEKAFYYYRAYCLAAICVGEFKSSKWAESIVQIIKWACGFNIERQRYFNYLDGIQSLARGMIPLTHRRYTIAALALLLEREYFNDEFRIRVSLVLGEIGVGNKVAISTLLSLLKRKDLSENYRFVLLEQLGKIGIGSKVATSTLISLLERKDLSKNHRLKIANALSNIILGDGDMVFVLSKKCHHIAIVK
jgi:GTPase SAR1 family protein